MKRLSLFLAILNLFSFSLFAQDKEMIDSLEQTVQSQAHDTLKIKAYGDLSWEYSFIDFNKALYYGEQELVLAEKLDRKTDIAQAYSDLGNAYTRVNRLKEALEYHQKAYDLRMELGLQEKAAGSVSNIAVIYKQSGKYKEAVENMIKALKIYEENGNERLQAVILGNIGGAYLSFKQLEQGRVAIERSIQLARKNNMAVIEANAYTNMVEYYFLKNEFDSALSVAFKSYELLKALNKQTDISIVLNSIGQIYVEKKQYKLALDYYQQGLAIREQMGDILGMGSSNKNIGYCYLQLGDYNKAESYLKKSINYFKDIDSKDYLREVYLFMSDLHQGKNDYRQALYYYSMAEDLEDSIYNKQTSDRISELNVEYETEKKVQQISLLNKENEIQKLQLSRRNLLILIISGLLIVSLLIGYLVYNRYRLKQAARLQAEIIKQQDAASKAIIEAEERERRRIAGDLHDGIGQMFSAVKMNLSGISDTLAFKDETQKVLFDKTIGLVDESCKEVRNISHNMMPNVLLKAGLASAIREFINKIDAHRLKVNLETFGLNERLESNVETVLYRVIQESVNNVIKHAQANQLDIQITKDTDGITVTIEDNGKGFDTSDSTNLEGIGLKNILTRIDFLKGTVEWDSSPGKGTLVAIHIPA